MIKAPKWCRDAVPVKAGWSDPKTGELLKVQNFSQEEIAEWHGVSKPEPAPEPEQVVEEDSETEE